MAFLRVFEGVLGKKNGLFRAIFVIFRLFLVILVMFIAQLLFRAAEEVSCRELGHFWAVLEWFMAFFEGF
jgi:hypothetical protein